MLPSRRACVLEATLAGVAFGGLELLASGWAPALDPPAGALGAAGVVGTGLLCGVFALFPWRPRLVTALIWALIWGPEAARVSGVSVWLGVVPALVLLSSWPLYSLAAIGSVATVISVAWLALIHVVCHEVLMA